MEVARKEFESGTKQYTTKEDGSDAIYGQRHILRNVGVNKYANQATNSEHQIYTMS